LLRRLRCGKLKIGLFALPGGNLFSGDQPDLLLACRPCKEELAMIKGIVGYRVKSDEDAEPLLRALAAHAMQYPGFVSAEALVSEKDFSVVVLTSTWQTAESWKTWQESKIVRDLLRQHGAVLAEEPRVTTYRVIPGVTRR
jgi:quinol monooxygenase YgiN